MPYKRRPQIPGHTPNFRVASPEYADIWYEETRPIVPDPELEAKVRRLAEVNKELTAWEQLLKWMRSTSSPNLQ